MIKPAKGRLLIKCDRDFKNNHTFESGLTIKLERNYNNLNHRETMPVQGELLAPYMDAPIGSTIIFHHNSIHPSNEIYNHSELSGEEIASNIGIYAIPESECYLWKTKDMTEWQPIKGYAIGLRCFQPYKGILQGIPHKKITDTLYVTSGLYKNKIVRTVKAADYEIIFRDENGKEKRLIRFRTFYPDYNEREEVLFIEEKLTKDLINGEILVGLTDVDCKILTEYGK